MAQRNRRRTPPRPAADPTRSGNPAVRSGERAARTPARRAPTRRPSGPAPEPEEVHPGHQPAAGATYPQLLRNEDSSWKLSLAGVIFGVCLYFLLVAVVSKATVALAWAITHPISYRDYYNQAIAFERPIGMLGANLGIATLIPISLVLVLVLHRTRTKWLFSVQPGIRWRYLLVCLVAGVVVLGGITVVSTVAAGTPLVLQQNFWLFAAVIVLTSPLQAMAEEVFFRGYVMQAVGSAVARPWVAVVTSAVIFALMHGTQNLPLFANRLAFGLLAGFLAWRTGGLEAGIAAHVANNLVAYLGAAVTTSIAALASVRALGWVDAGIQIGGFALVVLVSLAVARLMRVRNRVELSGPVVVTA